MTTQEFKQAQSILGLTNAEMANLLFCSLRLVEKIRQGERAVSARTARIIVQELHQRSL